MRENYLIQLTEVCADVLSKYISYGDTVIDATMGNGYDTLILAKLVGQEGKVYSFDIQQKALDITNNLVKEELGYVNNIVLIQDSHENINQYITDNVSAIVFNLGYLPGGNHAITTQIDSTMKAVEIGLDLLKKNGLISILIYEGHKEGKKEKEKLIEFGKSLDAKKFHVIILELINQKKTPPTLMLITKKY